MVKLDYDSHFFSGLGISISMKRKKVQKIFLKIICEIKM